MSAYSTLSITKSRARLEFMRYVMGEIDNRTLERFMDILLDHRLYNTRIVPDGTEPNDDSEAFGGRG